MPGHTLIKLRVEVQWGRWLCVSAQLQKEAYLLSGAVYVYLQDIDLIFFPED